MDTLKKKINKYKAKNAFLLKVLPSKTSGSTLLQSTDQYRCLRTSDLHTNGVGSSSIHFLTSDSDQYIQDFNLDLFIPLTASIHLSLLGLSCLPGVYLLVRILATSCGQNTKVQPLPILLFFRLEIQTALSSGTIYEMNCYSTQIRLHCSWGKKRLWKQMGT